MRLEHQLLLWCSLAFAGALRADPVDLEPFRATYSAEWKGISAGQSTLELRKDSGDTFTYTSVNTARGLFRMAFPDALTQTSTFRIVEDKVVPLRFRGMDEKQRPADLTFDWTANRVTGTAKGNAVDLELPPGTQDPMSLQIATLRKLASGQLAGSLWMLDGDKLKQYELRSDGTARISTELGEFDTVIYTSRRANSDRLTRTWVAPSLGYLPVKAERVRGKKVEFTLFIVSVDH